MSSHCPLSSWPFSACLCPGVPEPIRPQPPRHNPSLVCSMHCPLLHRSLRLRRRFRSSPVFADCQAHQIVTHQGLAVAPIELFKSMPCPLLNQSVPSTRATLPSSPVQSLRISVQFSNFALAVRVSAVRPPAPAVRIVAVPIRAVPPRCSAAHGSAVPPPFLSTQFNALSGPTISMLCRRPC